MKCLQYRKFYFCYWRQWKLFMIVTLRPPQINERDIPVQAETIQTGHKLLSKERADDISATPNTRLGHTGSCISSQHMFIAPSVDSLEYEYISGLPTVFYAMGWTSLVWTHWRVVKGGEGKGTIHDINDNVNQVQKRKQCVWSENLSADNRVNYRPDYFLISLLFHVASTNSRMRLHKLPSVIWCAVSTWRWVARLQQDIETR